MNDPDPRSALAVLLTRLAVAPRDRRSPVVVEILPMLADARLPLKLRLAASVRVLQVIPDRPRPVLRVVRAVTVGLPPSRALERMRELQNQLVKSRSLDALIETREKRIRLACPACGVRLPRVALVKHLWHEHGLVLDGRKTCSVDQRVAEFKTDFAASGNADALVTAAELSGAGGLRKWMAEDDAPAEEVEPLVSVARERGAGLCPGCFAEVAITVPSLPPPLTLVDGRLAGDGHSVALGGNAWFGRLTISTPDQRERVVRWWLSPRLAATLVASNICALTILAAPSIGGVLVGTVFALLLYGLVRLGLSPRDTNEIAITTAWQHLAPAAAERDDAARFLTRLCLLSLGRGPPDPRAKTLTVLMARARGRSRDSDEELQLLAAASVLAVEDTGHYGRDTVAGVADLVAEGFRGDHSADYAEHVAGSYLARDRDDGELARLRLMLLVAAFEAGLAPHDLRELWAVAPNLNRVMSVEPTHRLGLLHGLWRIREAEPWTRLGNTRTVFDIVRRSPGTAGSLLVRFPDLLLLHRPPDAIQSLVGPVVICARGVACGDMIVADPDAEARVTARGRELVFGRHRVPIAGRLPDDFPDVLKTWMRFRSEVLLPQIEGHLVGGTKDGSHQVLRPFCRKCFHCGTVSAVGRGQIGRAVSVQ